MRGWVGTSKTWGGHWCGRTPRVPPFARGGKVGGGRSLARGGSFGSLVGDALHPPCPPFARGGKVEAFARGRRRRLFSVCVLSGAVTLAGCGDIGRKEGASATSSGDPIQRSAQKGPVKLSVQVMPREPRLSDLVEMDVTVEAQPGVEIKAPAFGQAVGDFLIRDYTERPAQPGAPNTRRFHYELEPAHAGKHLIRSVSIEFLDNRANSEAKAEPVLIETEPLEVNVTSELGNEAPSLANLEPMVPPQSVPRVSTTAWVAAALAAGVLAIVAGIVVMRRRKRPVAEAPRLSPEEIAREALARLLSENLPARGLIKEFYLRLTGIVRQYVEDTTGIRAPEQTTEEFLRDMRSRQAFPREQGIRLAEFLEAADLIKYAGQTPEEGQIEEAIARAHEFVGLEPAPATAMAGAGADSR
jgi:hypothetical protein